MPTVLDVGRRDGAEAERIEIMEGRPTCRVEIHLKDGRTLHGECRHVKGNPLNPLTADERLKKFDANTANLPDKGEALSHVLRALDRASTLDDLNRALNHV